MEDVYGTGNQCCEKTIQLFEVHRTLIRRNSRPSGVPLHLVRAELKARQLDSFSTTAPEIAKQLRLPCWE